MSREPFGGSGGSGICARSGRALRGPATSVVIAPCFGLAQDPAAFFPSATTRRSASLTASAEPKCDQSSASMATISPTLRPAWWPRPGRRRNRGSLISGISSRDAALGSFGFFIDSSFMSRCIARADDADPVVARGGDDVEDTPGRDAANVMRLAGCRLSSKSWENGSLNASAASSKLTPCFTTLLAAFASSHSKSPCTTVGTSEGYVATRWRCRKWPTLADGPASAPAPSGGNGCPRIAKSAGTSREGPGPGDRVTTRDRAKSLVSFAASSPGARVQVPLGSLLFASDSWLVVLL